MIVSDTKNTYYFTPIYHRLATARSLNRYNIYVFEGGSRSGKTYSIIQYLIIYALSNKQMTRVVVARKRSTWLSATVWKDFLTIISMMNLNHIAKINKSSRTIQIRNTTFDFYGLDDVQRLHGLSCNAFWINEAIEASKDDFDQIEQRTSGFGILDYNPSAEEHWIYDSVCSRKDCYFDHSTMRQNPFIPANSLRKILSYEPTEENFLQGTADERKWKIYGLGMRAKIEGLVFNDYKTVPHIPDYVTKRWYCVDFGFSNDPTAIAEVGYYNNSLYINEICYNTNMLTRDIQDILKECIRARRAKIISESADPRLIMELQQSGLPIFPVRKYHGSVEAGLDFMKSCNIFITEQSLNAKKEFDNYTYQQSPDGKWLNVPEDNYNHIIDGVRYVCLQELIGNKSKPVNIKHIALALGR